MRGRDFPRGVPLTLWALLLLFAGLPLGVLAWDAVWTEKGFSLDAFTRSMADPADRRALFNTVRLVGGVSVFTFLVGVPLGFLFGRTDLPGKRPLSALCTAPFAVPPYVLGIAWIQLLNPSAGWLNRGTSALGLPPMDIYSLPGMVWVMGLALTPLVMLGTADALRRMDATVEEAARMAGASPLRVMATITLPMALPAVLASLSMVVATTAAAFGVPYLLSSGSADSQPVLTTRIFYRMALDPTSGRAQAVGLSALLAGLGVLLPLVLLRLAGRRSFATVTGKAGRASPFPLGRWRWPLAVGVAIYAGLAVVLPVSIIALTSLMQNIGGGVSPSNLTFSRWREVLWGRPDTVRALEHSVWLGAAAATAAVLLGGLIAWIRERSATRGRGQLASLASLPYSIPGTVLALGFLLCFSREMRVMVLSRATFTFALADTLWMLGIAYTVKELAVPVRSLGAALASLHPSLEEAGRMAGAGAVGVLSSITMPLLKSPLLSAWVLVFLPCFSEVTLSILLRGPETSVVGTVLFDLQSYGDPPAAAVLAMLVLLTVALGTGLLALASRFSASNQPSQ